MRAHSSRAVTVQFSTTEWFGRRSVCFRVSEAPHTAGASVVTPLS